MEKTDIRTLDANPCCRKKSPDASRLRNGSFAQAKVYGLEKSSQALCKLIQPMLLQDMRAGHDVTGGRGGSVVAERIVGCIANHNRFIPALFLHRVALHEAICPLRVVFKFTELL